MEGRKKIKGISEKVINILFGISMVFVGWLLIQVLFLTSFKIPSDSMEPVLETGDYLLVWKGIPGPRIFHLFKSLDGEQVDIYRLLGIRKVKRNDVVVFNFPHPDNWGKIEMHILKYYVKRCIGLPGDTLTIRNGLFRVNGGTEKVGNVASQQLIEQMPAGHFESDVYHTYPFDSIMGWNIKDFGPLYIPRKGDILPIDRENYQLYKKLIAWEQGTDVSFEDSILYVGEKHTRSYTFQKNYYFMAGDKGINSQDSRYWGLLPEEYIVGRAWMIWKSVDPYTGGWKWKRIGKVVD